MELGKWIEAIKGNERWHIELYETPVNLPEGVKEHEAALPPIYIAFIKTVKTAMTDLVWIVEDDPVDSSIWAYTAEDMRGNKPNDWIGEFKRISLEAAEGDDEMIAEIESFWSGHIPVLVSLSSGYAFHALRLSDGKIVHGFEPEFEKTSVIADDFAGWLELTASGEFRKHL